MISICNKDGVRKDGEKGAAKEKREWQGPRNPKQRVKTEPTKELKEAVDKLR